jgi:hypothetical protein
MALFITASRLEREVTAMQLSVLLRHGSFS